MRALPTIAQGMRTRFFEPKRIILEPPWKVSTVKEQEYAEGDGLCRISVLYFCRIPQQYCWSMFCEGFLSLKSFYDWIICLASQNPAFRDGSFSDSTK